MFIASAQVPLHLLKGCQASQQQQGPPHSSSMLMPVSHAWTLAPAELYDSLKTQARAS